MLSLPELCHDMVYSFLDAKAVCNLMACNQWLLDHCGSIVQEIVLRNRNNAQEGQQHIPSLLRRRPRLMKITTMDVFAFEGVVATMMLGQCPRITFMRHCFLEDDSTCWDTPSLVPLCQALAMGCAPKLESLRIEVTWRWNANRLDALDGVWSARERSQKQCCRLQVLIIARPPGEDNKAIPHQLQRVLYTGSCGVRKDHDYWKETLSSPQ